MTDSTDCVFCGRIAAGQYDVEYPAAVAFEPLNPVTDGHTLVVPRVHVPDATTDPQVTAAVMAVAAELARQHRASNIITSVGAEATQTIRHLHLHIVPRRTGDGLFLPWTGRTGQRVGPPNGVSPGTDGAVPGAAGGPGGD